MNLQDFGLFIFVAWKFIFQGKCYKSKMVHTSRWDSSCVVKKIVATNRDLSFFLTVDIMGATAGLYVLRYNPKN